MIDESAQREWTEADRATFRCIDCGVDTSSFSGIGEYYTVLDDVWPIGTRDGMLCIGCLEARLGRQLTPADFDLTAPVNHPELFPGMRFSARIRDRLGIARNTNTRYR